MWKSKFRLIIPTLLIFILSSCNMPGSTPADPQETAAILTAVAQTVAAESNDQDQETETTLEPTQTADSGELQSTDIPPTNTPAPSETPTPSETPIPCNLAEFEKDVTIPDGKVFEPGAAFTKTWRLKNVGSCTWTSGYQIIFDSGDAMDAPSAVQLTGGTVDPGEKVDVSVNLKAPASEGTYRGNWKMRDPSDVVFGIENSTQGVFWVEIKVKEPEPEEQTKEFNFSSRGMVEQNEDVRTNANNVGDTIINKGLQGFLTYDISSIPDDAEILSAKMVISENYDTLGDPFGSLGCLRAYVDNYGNLDLGDYTAPGVTGAIVRFCNEADLADPGAQTLNSIGISGIEASLASDTFQIRLQFKDDHTDNDNIEDMVRGPYKLIVTYKK